MPPAITDRPSEMSSKKGDNIDSHRRIESVSSLSKLESYRGGGHSRQGSMNVPLTERRIFNLANLSSNAGRVSDTALPCFNAPISDRNLEHSLAPASFRELLAGIAQNMTHMETPR